MDLKETARGKSTRLVNKVICKHNSKPESTFSEQKKQRRGG